jgi:putative tryptophan/tyrosine transport system substrate-binding protein
MIALAALSLAILLSLNLAQAQQREKLPTIGFLQRRVEPTLVNPDPLASAFRQGLRELGYLEGKNIQIEHRYAGGKSDRLKDLVTELVQLQVDVLVIPSIQALRIAKQVTTSIPIVMVTPNDPVQAGLVTSLAKPSGNITGITRLTRGLSGKRLEILKETMPNVARVGILTGTTTTSLEEFEPAARMTSVSIQSMDISDQNADLERVFAAAVRKHINGLITIRDAVTASYIRSIAELAIKHRLPSMNEDSSYVELGGLMSYAANDADQFRRAAYYVDRILKGAKPAELPVEQPTKFELFINLKTAKQIGLTIPPSVIARADKVIK